MGRTRDRLRRLDDGFAPARFERSLYRIAWPYFGLTSAVTAVLGIVLLIATQFANCGVAFGLSVITGAMCFDAHRLRRRDLAQHD